MRRPSPAIRFRSAHGRELPALHMALGMRDLSASDLPTAAQMRVSTITHFRAIDRQPALVFPPQRHRDFLREVYSWLELPRTFGEAAAVALPETSAVKVVHSAEMNFATIKVSAIGADCVDRVRDAMNAERKAGAEAIYLRLPLASPRLPHRESPRNARSSGCPLPV